VSEANAGIDDPEFYRAVVGSSTELITVFDLTGRVMFINKAVRVVLGYEPESVVGRHILEFVHPDDLERAGQTLHIAANFGTSLGTTHFRLRASDGSWPTLEMSSGTLFHRGDKLLMTIARQASTRFAFDSALRSLAEDRPLTEVLQNVMGLFTWHSAGSHVAVAWRNGDGAWAWIGTPGCPVELSGTPMREGSLWADALVKGEDQIAVTPGQMRADVAAAAAASGRGGYWISPLSGTDRPAVISVWMALGGFPPMFHNEGMALSRRFVRLIMRWADQHDRIERAAKFDELTGLANRPSFFDALSASSHGAILYCDLDRFKPVNDQYGHAAGDEVLRQVAQRLRDSVRAGDTVARIGGDEFAIICPASTAADAASLAERLRAAVEPPIDVGSASVQVGISIGIAHTTDRLDAASVAAADRDLYAAKAARTAGYHRR
jgi:diguanylate cyclase (GGDEF)-like protein/PAS domain S-box-containing protein